MERKNGRKEEKKMGKKKKTGAARCVPWWSWWQAHGGDRGMPTKVHAGRRWMHEPHPTGTTAPIIRFRSWMDRLLAVFLPFGHHCFISLAAIFSSQHGTGL